MNNIVLSGESESRYTEHVMCNFISILQLDWMIEQYFHTTLPHAQRGMQDNRNKNNT